MFGKRVRFFHRKDKSAKCYVVASILLRIATSLCLMVAILWWHESKNKQQTKVTLPPSFKSANLTDNETIEISKFLDFAREVGPSHKDRELFRFLLLALDMVCTNANVSYFLYSGSLLGAFRVNDILAWDDDIDVAISAHDVEKFLLRTRLEAEVKNISITAHLKSQHMIKFFSPELSQLEIKPYEWKWPFIDVFLYYNESQTPAGEIFINMQHSEVMSVISRARDNVTNDTVNDKRIVLAHDYFLNKSSVFPLSTAFFMGVVVPVPAQTKQCLVDMFGRDVFRKCETNHYDHRTESVRSLEGTKICVECKLIWNYFYGNRTLPT